MPGGSGRRMPFPTTKSLVQKLEQIMNNVKIEPRGGRALSNVLTLQAVRGAPVQTTMPSKPYRILSLDGGGTWALIQAKALGEIYGADTDGWTILNRFDFAA